MINNNRGLIIKLLSRVMPNYNVAITTTGGPMDQICHMLSFRILKYDHYLVTKNEATLLPFAPSGVIPSTIIV